MAGPELDRVVLKGYSLLAFVGRVPRRVVSRHYVMNQRIWLKRQRECESLALDGLSYLEYQSRLLGKGGEDAICYGRRRKKPLTADYNSCEVIAVYNVMRYFRREVSFPELLRDFERKGIALGGAFGTSPAALVSYLEREGFSVKCLCGKQLMDFLPSVAEEAQAFLVCLYNDRQSLQRGLHTLCVTRQGDQFLLHNDYRTYGKQGFDSLEAATCSYRNGDSRLWAVLGISSRSRQ